MEAKSFCTLRSSGASIRNCKPMFSNVCVMATPTLNDTMRVFTPLSLTEARVFSIAVICRVGL